eukprot:XP_001709731.1 Hypothetical protein GL50803_36915 [Giardia lamblia ATCC 50803]
MHEVVSQANGHVPYVFEADTSGCKVCRGEHTPYPYLCRGNKYMPCIWYLVGRWNSDLP